MNAKITRISNEINPNCIEYRIINLVASCGGLWVSCGKHESTGKCQTKRLPSALLNQNKFSILSAKLTTMLKGIILKRWLIKLLKVWLLRFLQSNRRRGRQLKLLKRRRIRRTRISLSQVRLWIEIDCICVETKSPLFWSKFFSFGFSYIYNFRLFVAKV